MSEFTEPAVGRPEGAPAYQFVDTLAYVRIPGDRTDGRCSVVELQFWENHATPEHIHEEADETIHVLEGAVTVHTADTTPTVPAGGTVVLPRGEKHAIVAEEQSVILVSTTPATFDGFVTAVGEPTDDETVPTEPPSEEVIERAHALAPEHGIEMVGPPPDDH